MLSASFKARFVLGYQPRAQQDLGYFNIIHVDRFYCRLLIEAMLADPNISLLKFTRVNECSCEQLAKMLPVTTSNFLMRPNTIGHRCQAPLTRDLIQMQYVRNQIKQWLEHVKS